MPSPKVASHPIHQSSGAKLLLTVPAASQIGRHGVNKGGPCSGKRGLARTGGGLKDGDFPVFKAAIKGLHELELDIVRGERMVEILWRHAGRHAGGRGGRGARYTAQRLFQMADSLTEIPTNWWNSKDQHPNG